MDQGKLESWWSYLKKPITSSAAGFSAVADAVQEAVTAHLAADAAQGTNRVPSR